MLACVLASQVTGTAQTVAPAAQAPTFRSTVRLIDVDVYVTDQDGRPVKGLTQDDFELLEDGRLQELRAFTAVDLPIAPDDSSPSDARSAGGPEPDVVINSNPGRMYVIVLDSPYAQFPDGSGLQEFGGRGGYDFAVRRVASQFIREAVGPRDQVAIVNVHGPRSGSQGLTGNRQLLQEAIDKYGQGGSGATSSPDRCPATPEIATRIVDTYRALADVSSRLGGVSGRRKTIIWIGGQLPFTQQQPGECTPGSLTVTNILDRQWPTILQARRESMRVATRNNVAIFPIDPAGLTTDLGPYELERLGALREVAEETGGSAVVGTNNFAGGIERIVRENSTYYVLGYSPSTDYDDGKFHDIKVRVKQRPALLVHARKGYTAPDGKATPAAEPPLPEGISIAARDALRSFTAVNGVAIELASATFRGAGEEGVVILDAQVRADKLTLAGGERITLSYQVLDNDNRIVTGAYKVFLLDFRERSRQQIAREGLRFVDRIGLKPGRYEVRLVVDQPDLDTLGSVTTHVNVPEPEGSLSMSGVLIGSISTADHRALFADEKIRERVSVDPTAVRRFPEGDELAVYAELYGDDVAGDDAEVTVRLISAGGTAVVKEDGTAVDADAGKGFRALVSLADAAPGNYVLRVEGRAGMRDPVVREIPIVVVAD
jgi:VWFA-related protein